jgi:ribonuclease-3 family protein
MTGNTQEETKAGAAAPAFMNGLEPHMTEAEARQVAPLSLAFLGDAVYELHIRTMAVQTHSLNPNGLNELTSSLAKAATQAAAAMRVMPSLTEEEAAILRRGRNAKSKTMAKHASMSDYRLATGFEAMIGYLYLTGQDARVLEIIRKGVLPDEETDGKPENE